MSTLPLILNPTAGGGRCGPLAEQALGRLRRSGMTLELHTTTGPGHATTLAQQLIEAGHTTLLCAGGDGTAYELLNGVFPRDPHAPRPTLGLIPLGTGNSFLRDLGITTAEQSLDAILASRSQPVDVVKATHTTGAIHYLNLLSIGFTSDVCTLTNRRFKPIGPAGYGVATVIEIARLAPRALPYACDDGPFDRDPLTFLSFSNSRCTAGTMQMAPDARINDGQLDVIRVGAVTRLGLLRAFPRIYKGTHPTLPFVTTRTARTVRFDLPGPIDVMVDGEVVPLHLTQLDVLPKAVEIFA